MAELGVHESALLTDLALCVNRWRLFSPGWYVCVLARVQLSAEEWEVPGLVAMVNYGRKKQCEVRDEVFHGPPNFVLDVFDAADDQNFLRRRDRFCKYGVHEYVAILNDDPKAIVWHRLDAGGYRSVEPDDDGIINSEALPNFWVPLNALRDRDWWTVLGCIEWGVSRRANFSSTKAAADLRFEASVLERIDGVDHLTVAIDHHCRREAFDLVALAGHALADARLSLLQFRVGRIERHTERQFAAFPYAAP